MKNLKEFINNKIWFINLGLVIFIVCLDLILYIFDLKFRLSFILIMGFLLILGLDIGILKWFLTKINFSKNIGKWILKFIVYACSFVFASFIFIKYLYVPEHLTVLDGKKYIAIVTMDKEVDVSYYEIWGPFFRSIKESVHGYFGKGIYDPFISEDRIDKIVYSFYDEKGKILLEKEVSYVRNEYGKFIRKEERDLNKVNNYLLEHYLLPEDGEVLYETRFDDTILRFVLSDYVLGQNMLVKVVRSRDGGENFYYMSDQNIQVSLQAKFSFLDENLGFAISTGNVSLDEFAWPGLYVTNDGGKTFEASKFNYKEEGVDMIKIENFPYFENDKLYMSCSVYDMAISAYKNILFKSDNKGLVWEIKSN